MFKLIFTILMVIFLSGCSSKQNLNNSASFLYQSMINSINTYDLEKAGDYFSSLKGSHPKSIFLPEAMLIMANAHIDKEEYLLANFYLDQYLQRFANKDNIEFVKFLKLKANYYSFKQPNREQKLLLETIEKAKLYKQDSKGSILEPYAASIVTTLKFAKVNMDLEIANLYDKRDKPQAAKIYRQRANADEFKDFKIVAPNRFWLRKIFE